MYSVHIFVIALAVSCTAASSISRQLSDTEDFDYLLFAQFWPYTSCLYFESRHDSCSIPDDVNGFTIHGLWPSIKGTEKPQYCNNTTKFDFSLIQSLSTQLETNWPYFDTDGDKTTLWDHEWTKHGTCAYPLPEFQGEFRYFNETLHLHTFQNTVQVLAKGGIVPSETQTYAPQRIFDVLKTGYGVIPNIICFYDKKTHTHYLDQVWLCFDKQLNRQDCYGVSTTHMGTHTLYFQSMLHQKPEVNGYFQDCPTDGSVYFKPNHKRIH